MKIAKQKDLFGSTSDYRANRISHGGELSKGRRKMIRPLDRNKPLHVIFKSSLAKGQYSFLNVNHRLKIESLIQGLAKRFGIKIHRMENVGNHIHLVLSFAKRIGMQSFLRSVPALIARLVTGARRAKAFGKKFWDHLVFTRVVTGRRDFQSLMNYMQKNQIERESGPLNRKAVEFYEEVQRKAKRRRVGRNQRKESDGAGNLHSVSANQPN